MQPRFRIIADRHDVTRAVADRLIELIITDEAGLASDVVRLTLDDRRRADGAIAQLPRIGTQLEVALSYAGGVWVPMGRYIIDEVEISAPPATLTVSGKAADMVGPFRSPKTRSWHDTTLGRIVEAIAAEHGYTPKIDPELGAIAIPHVDQTEESDMALLTRLASKHDAVSKPVAGHLVLAKRGAAKSVTGQALPTITLRPDQISEWRYQYSARRIAGKGGSGLADNSDESHGGVKAYWWDYQKGERREVVVGNPPYEELRYVHATEAEARAAAATRKNRGERSQAELSFRMPGDPRLAAEARLSIALRPVIPTRWRITRVEHRLSAQGYSTSVECERDVTDPISITQSEVNDDTP